MSMIEQRILIVAPVPTVRSWPFYGHALQTISSCLSWPKDELAAFEEAIAHRRLVAQHLADARKSVALLEADLTAIDKIWPSENRP